MSQHRFQVGEAVSVNGPAVSPHILFSAARTPGSEPGSLGSNPDLPATLSPSPCVFGVVAPFVRNSAVFGGICGRWPFAVIRRDGEVARIL
jgi:hypothetical protein